MAEPEMKLVPREPTQAIIDAHDLAHAKAETFFAEPADVWRAMYDAAPTAPRLSGDLVERLTRAVYDYQRRMGLHADEAAEDAGGMAESFGPIVAETQATIEHLSAQVARMKEALRLARRGLRQGADKRLVCDARRAVRQAISGEGV